MSKKAPTPPKALLPPGKFPHRLPIFSATMKVVLWTGIITLVVVNLSLVRPTAAFFILRNLHLAVISPVAVLGTTDTQREARELRNAKEQEFAYWQQVIVTHPDYRDAYIRLVALSYELGSPKETALYGEKLRQLDPNNAFVQKLSGVLSEQ